MHDDASLICLIRYYKKTNPVKAKQLSKILYSHLIKRMKSGDAIATYLLSNYYFHHHDIKKSNHYLKISAENGDLAAQIDMMGFLINKPTQKILLNRYIAAIKTSPNLYASFRLGLYYYYVKHNHKMGLQYLSHAVDYGYILAYPVLANIYSKNNKTIPRAIKLINTAVDVNYGKYNNIANLAMIYYGQHQYKKAHVLNKLAFEHDSCVAASNTIVLIKYHRLSNKYYNKAMKILTKGTKNNNFVCKTSLAITRKFMKSLKNNPKYEMYSFFNAIFNDKK